MISLRKVCFLLGSWVCFGGSALQAAVVAQVDVPAAAIGGGQSAGDRLIFLVQFEDNADVVAVELSTNCSSDALRVADVTFDAAFARVLTEDAAQLPAQTYSSARARDLDSLSPPESAGASGLQVAVITVDVTTDAPFQEFVEVTVNAVVTGPVQQPTTIRTADGRESASGTIRIPIQSLGAPGWQSLQNVGVADGASGPTAAIVDGATSDADDEPPPPLVDLAVPPSASVSLEVIPAHGSGAVTALHTGQAYELHFNAGDMPIHGYSLFVVSDSPGHGFSFVAQPADGAWAYTGEFAIIDPERTGVAERPGVGSRCPGVALPCIASG